MRITIFFCLALLSGITLCAQIEKADSLERILNISKTTAAEQIELYKQLYDIYALNDVQKAKSYAEKGLAVATREKDKANAGRFNEQIAKVYTNINSYDTAFMYYEQAMKLALESNSLENQTSILINSGFLYLRQHGCPKAIECLTQALNLIEKTNNKRHLWMTYNGLGSAHLLLGSHSRAIYFYGQAKTIADELGDLSAQVRIYCDLGGAYLEANEIDKALGILLKGLELSRNLGDFFSQNVANQNLGVIYSKFLGDYDTGFKYMEESVRIARQMGNPTILIPSMVNLAAAYMEHERYQDANSLLNEAWEMDTTNLHAGPALTINLAMANLYLGNKDKAVDFIKKNHDINRKIIDKTYQETLLETEVKYETEKKEMKIALLEKEKILYIWLGIAAVTVLLLILGILFYRHRLNLQKRKLAEQQQELAEQRIKQLEQEKQLIATQALLDGETAERSRLARDLHDGLGGMLSVIKLNIRNIDGYPIVDDSGANWFNKALELLDESIGELRRVAHHLMPESLIRSGLRVSLEDFCRVIPGTNFYYLGKDSRLDDRLEVLIYRCAYEMVNNAIKHANATNINVQLMIENGVIALTVQDNGTGFDPETVTLGVGLENIRTRVSAYNGKISIHSVPGNGTEISIEIEPQS